MIPFARWWLLGRRLSAGTSGALACALSAVGSVSLAVSSEMLVDAAALCFREGYMSGPLLPDVGGLFRMCVLMESLSALVCVAAAAFAFRVCVAVSRGLGHGRAFAAGLLLLEPVFVCVAAWRPAGGHHGPDAPVRDAR